MENKVYGYARVSTREQNEDRQMIALENYPMSRKQIYLDKLSGKDFNRPQYQKLLRKIRAGDTIVIKSIDWDVIMKKYKTNGVKSLKKKM